MGRKSAFPSTAFENGEILANASAAPALTLHTACTTNFSPSKIL